MSYYMSEMSLISFTKHLPMNHRVRAEMNAIANTIGLLNSMVNGGEEHSESSREQVKEALDYLRKY